MNWADCTSPITVNGITTSSAATLNCIPPLIVNVISWLLTFASVVALFFIIIGGYKYIISHGDQKKIEEARRTLSYSILGLVVVFLSFFLVQFIATVTGVKCLNFLGFGFCT